MRSPPEAVAAPAPGLPKCPSGIRGLDAITNGGLPRGRPTLVCGGAGTGKTLLAMEFLVRGIQEHHENGVFICFEERATDLAQNCASLGFHLPALIADRKLMVDPVVFGADQITETGEYNLDGLFLRLGADIAAVGAKRVVLDSIEALFTPLSHHQTLRGELCRLFAWLREKGMTAIVTGEQGDGMLTRRGLEEYVSDCVILLDQRVINNIATRRLRIVKYRGSTHGNNEYPFLIGGHGFTVLPITDSDLQYTTSRDIISTGVPKLDAMFSRQGCFRGGTLLVTGTAGTGKTSLAAHFAEAACRRGERCLYFAFEESPDQIERNMQSIGIDLGCWVAKGLLRFAAARPASFGLEVHLSVMLGLTDAFAPQIVILDSVSALESAGTLLDSKFMLMRMVDVLKSRQITVFLTSLTSAGLPAEQSEVGISSLVDTWVVLRNLEHAGERTRALYIVKSRGLRHSNQARELLLTDHGADLVEVVVGPDGKILTGSARTAQELLDHAAAATLQQDAAGRQAALLHKQKIMEARIAEMQAEFAAEAAAAGVAISRLESATSGLLTDRTLLARQREEPGGLPDAARKTE